jgi:hypothetical protein
VTITPLYLFMIAVIAWGFIGNSYQFYGKQQGWTVTDWFERWALGSVVIIPAAAVIIWYYNGWLKSLIAVVAGFLVAFLLTNILRQRVQFVWAAFGLLLVVMTAWTFASRLGLV